MKIISVLSDFSEYPGLRHCSISDMSGELFYHNVVNNAFFNAINSSDKLTVNLDGTDGYAPSFIDEVFGNLVYDFTLDVVKKNLIVISEQEPHWKEKIEQSMVIWENRRIKNETPIVTAEHPAWYRGVNGNFENKVWSRPTL